MGKALYRKYRSKSLSEIIGQEHITTTLENALKNGTVSHAYLFTGPRGVGKTSVARILAHEVNGLPYTEEQPHLDIIEIDAASNRRIDEIRELKDRVHIAPSSAKYRVYIIDEVHMLTREAFNALLKTLEEPPEHAIFILATTEAHKVPETIISRTQRLSFKPVTSQEVVGHLKDIAKKEKINIDEPALELIAAHGEGSFRDSIGLLDQVRHVGDPIGLEKVQQALGQAPQEALISLMSTLKTGSISDVARQLADLKQSGVQASQVAHQLSHLVRSSIIEDRPVLGTEQSLRLLHELALVSAANDPSLKLELVLYGISLNNQRSSDSVKARPADSKPDKKAKIEPKTPAVNMPAESTETIDLDSDNWPQILAAIKTRHNTLYGITRMAVPSFEEGKLTLTFAFAFHQKRLKEAKNQQMLLKIIKETTGQDVILDCLVDTSAGPSKTAVQTDTEQPNVDLQTISNIFGGAEVVE